MTNPQAALIAASNVVREEYVKDAAEKFLRWLDKQDAERKSQGSSTGVEE